MEAVQRWRKSARSTGGANNCVEVAVTLDAVRDSKNQTATLSVSVADLLAAVKAGKLDR